MNTVALTIIILLNSVTIVASFHTVVWTNCATWYRNRGDKSNAPIPLVREIRPMAANSAPTTTATRTRAPTGTHMDHK